MSLLLEALKRVESKSSDSADSFTACTPDASSRSIVESVTTALDAISELAGALEYDPGEALGDDLPANQVRRLASKVLASFVDDRPLGLVFVVPRWSWEVTELLAGLSIALVESTGDEVLLVSAQPAATAQPAYGRTATAQPAAGNGAQPAAGNGAQPAVRNTATEPDQQRRWTIALGLGRTQFESTLAADNTAREPTIVTSSVAGVSLLQLATNWASIPKTPAFEAGLERQSHHEALWRTWKRHDRHVVVQSDSPSQFEYLSGADGVYLAVAMSNTRRARVINCVARLQAAGVPIRGSVLIGS